MAEKKYTSQQTQLARFAKAMGHPARMAILEFLSRQKCCFFGDINEELPISKATVSQHLKELKESGLIQGNIEPPKVRYCLNKENWELARTLFADFFSMVSLGEPADTAVVGGSCRLADGETAASPASGSDSETLSSRKKGNSKGKDKDKDKAKDKEAEKFKTKDTDQARSEGKKNRPEGKKKKKK